MGNTQARQQTDSSEDELELRRFLLRNVHDTGNLLGRGSYAEVRELRVGGRKCAGKKLHALLFASASIEEKEKMLSRFKIECSLLASLKHPNVVEFVGVYWESGSRLPILVMEFLPLTLAAYVEENGTILMEGVRYTILHDVAQGLQYLHKLDPPVVHRDLSANNVLLTESMQAKISDLGVAKIINVSPEQMTQRTSTQAPGTPCYMPPEALVARPRYNTKLDIYSYGVLVIHLLCGRWPFPSDLFQPDPKDPGNMVAVEEVERRREYLQQIGETHPLMDLIRQCLHNNQSRRPDTLEIVEKMSTMLHRSPTTPDTTVAKLDKNLEQLAVATGKASVSQVCHYNNVIAL